MEQTVCDNFKLLSLESELNPEIKIKIEGEEFCCNRQLLESSCDYFKALQSFDSSDQAELVIKGGLDSQSFCIILEFLKDGILKIDLSNFENILQSCLFLPAQEVNARVTVDQAAPRRFSPQLSRLLGEAPPDWAGPAGGELCQGTTQQG